MGEHACLVKFGSLEHLTQLQQDGLVFMNPLPLFWELENDELRADPADGVAALERGDAGQVSTLEGERIPIIITAWELRFPLANADRINVFCMYALRPDAGTFPVESRNFGFGSHALLLLYPQQFIDRLDAHLHMKRIPHKAGLVEYVSNDHRGRMGPLRKLERFSYQSEWRLVCYEGSGGPRTIQIGNLESISILVPIQRVNSAFKACYK
jgi:hypothetical protein